MTRRVKQLHQAVPEAYVELNPVDARALGVKDGDSVKLVTRRGDLTLRASIDHRGRPPKGSVFVPFFDESLLVNRLTLDAMDNISKQPDYKKCAVRLERV
jgi:nitrate reductase NapA